MMQLKQRIAGHESNVQTLVVSKSELYSSSTKTLVHNLETLQYHELNDNGYSVIRKRETESHLYSISGNCLYLLDPRCKSETLLHTSPEDLNDIALHQNNTIIGVVNDAGTTTILDPRSPNPIQIQTNDNITSCIAFRPTLPWQVFTGGFDCNLTKWDYSKRFTSKYSFIEHKIGDEVYNPPFCVSMDFDHSGNQLVVGLGDGAIAYFDRLDRKKGFGDPKVLKQHTWSVSSIRIDRIGDKSRIVSGGIDGKVCLWENEKLVSETNISRKVNDMAILDNHLYVCGLKTGTLKDFLIDLYTL